MRGFRRVRSSNFRRNLASESRTKGSFSVGPVIESTRTLTFTPPDCSENGFVVRFCPPRRVNALAVLSSGVGEFVPALAQGLALVVDHHPIDAQGGGDLADGLAGEEAAADFLRRRADGVAVL